MNKQTPVPTPIQVTELGDGYYAFEGEDGARYVLDLQRVQSPTGYEQAARAILERDPIEFIISAHDNVYSLGLVLDNTSVLHKRGMLEPCMAEAWVSTRTNNCGWSAAHLVRAFSACDRDKLQAAAGCETPEGDRFKVYRGVSGVGAYRRVNGLSWTDSLDCACWFAMRHGGREDPAIVTATLYRSDLFFFTDGRDEREFVARPKSYKRMKIHIDDIKNRAAAWTNTKTTKAGVQ